MFVDLEKTLIQSTAIIDCPPSSINKQQLAATHSIQPIEPELHTITSKQHTTATCTYSPSCEILKSSSFTSPSNCAVVGEFNDKIVDAVVPNDVRPFSALYDIICKEKEFSTIMSNAQHTDQLAEKLCRLNMGLAEQNGSTDCSAAVSGNVDQININSETEQKLLDRSHHSYATSQQNSKFSVAYKDQGEKSSDIGDGGEGQIERRYVKFVC